MTMDQTKYDFNISYMDYFQYERNGITKIYYQNYPGIFHGQQTIMYQVQLRVDFTPAI